MTRGASPGASRTTVVQRSAWASSPNCWIPAKYTRTVPRNATAMPTEQISRYLYEASSEDRVRSKFTRKTEASVVPSIATHMSPTSSVETASSIVKTKRWKSG